MYLCARRIAFDYILITFLLYFGTVSTVWCYYVFHFIQILVNNMNVVFSFDLFMALLP
jgi:hypothetical protein